MTQQALLGIEVGKTSKSDKPDPVRQWMKRHGITAHFAPHCKPWCWSAWIGDMDDIANGVEIYEGTTRNKALRELCEKESLPTWEEEYIRHT